MITIEHKIEQFRRMVLGHAQHALEEKVAILDQSDLLMMETIKRDLEKLGSKHIEEHLNMAFADRKRQLAKAKLGKIHSLLKIKHEFVESVIEALKVKSKELTLLEGYKEAVFNDIRSCTANLDSDNALRLFLMAESMNWANEVTALLNRFRDVEVHEALEDIIGGVIVESETTGERYDMSFLSRIIYSEAFQGGRVFEILNEEASDHV
jgi:vacuolar-type H+-ATPase subunit E/Vma4